MTPQDLRTVQTSWPALLGCREELLASLARHLGDLAPTPIIAADRSCWLFRAVEELVELLPEPSRLESSARHLAETWPDKLIAPCFAVDGKAWMRASGECIDTWSPDVEAAWRQAWLLLSEVLAAETLSPFADGAPSHDDVVTGDVRTNDAAPGTR
jgi:hypothetical protein